MATPTTDASGWSFKDTENLLTGLTGIYNNTMQAKTAEANATTATQNRSALDSQINAQASAPSGFTLDTKTILIGGGVAVAVIGAIIALK